MNYLAHFYLAQASERRERAGYTLGGLLGDFVKGPLNSERNRALLENSELPYATGQGIALHRFIDANFDTLASIKSVRQAQPPALRRYGGILIDLAFDNILSEQWPTTQLEKTLLEFEGYILADILPYRDRLPKKARTLLTAFNDYHILSRYGESDVLEGTLFRIAERLQSKELKSANESLWATKAALLPYFDAILKEMQSHTLAFMTKQ